MTCHTDSIGASAITSARNVRHQRRALLDVDPPPLLTLAPALSQFGVGRGRLAQRENHPGGAPVDARDERLAYTVSTETPAARATSRIPVAAQPRSPNKRAAAEATIARVSAACCSRRGER
jgi:hypothetical protein